MSMKSLLLSAAIGLGGLSLSGCIYDGGPYYYEGPGYYGSGYYAGGAVIYDRGGYYRHPRYYHRRIDREHHRPPPPPSPPPQAQLPEPPRAPVIVDRSREHRGQHGQIFLPPEGGYRHN